MSSPVALFRAMRPHQWTKNLFVFAPLLFAGAYRHRELTLRVAVTFAIFCLVSSAVYLVNDVRDREADRLHPRKKNRPIASGALSVPVALIAAVVLLCGGLVWAWLGLASEWPLKIMLTYVVIQIGYSFGLKRLVIIDVLCISSGFVLRLLAGASSAWVPSSRWIVVCTIFISVFLALCKRRHEVVSLGENASGHRAILLDYPLPLLDQLISAAVSGTLATYALYAVESETMTRVVWGGISPMALTIPCVIYGMFRYLYLVYRRDVGGSPTTVLLRDIPLLANGVLYLVLVVYIQRFI